MSNRNKKRQMVLSIFAGLCVLAVWQGTRAIEVFSSSDVAIGAPREQAQVVAVTFSSAWCGPCKILKPRLTKLQSRVTSLPVRFVELDFTFGDQADILDIVERENITDVYASYRKATGFTVLVDARNGKVLDILTTDYSVTAMQRAVDRALGLTAQPT